MSLISNLQKHGSSLLKRYGQTALERINDHNPSYRTASRLAAIERESVPTCVMPRSVHVDDAISWLKRAQDADSSNGGVAWGYRARRPVRTDFRLGWVEAYPETTGYIIPTMLRYSDWRSDPDSAARAERMAEWELRIQLKDGGIQGGVYGGASPIAASTFVTGQVLFGLTAMLRRTNDEPYRVAGTRAANFLLSCLEQGRFVRGHSLLCAPGPKAYEVRTALALADFGVAVGSERYITAASQMADFALSCQEPNGWFRNADLDDHERPLTHTLAYTLEGLHGLGRLLNRGDCIDAVHLTLQNLLPRIGSAGFLAGRLTREWEPAVTWACLTGTAQLGGVFVRMHRDGRNSGYLDTGRRLLGFVAYTQEMQLGIPEVDGGIRGSYPFSRDYGQWCVLNWATKFFADSVMDYLDVA